MRLYSINFNLLEITISFDHGWKSINGASLCCQQRLFNTSVPGSCCLHDTPGVPDAVHEETAAVLTLFGRKIVCLSSSTKFLRNKKVFLCLILKSAFGYLGSLGRSANYCFFFLNQILYL